jgi:hypothetical protein
MQLREAAAPLAKLCVHQTAARRAWKFRASARILTSCKPRFDTLSLTKSMLLQRFVIMTPFLGPQPWEAPDPLPVMRRELKLLLIEMNLLRIEVEQSRSIREEAQAREAFFSASVKQLTEGRDKWRREAERLRDLIEQGPPWSLLLVYGRRDRRYHCIFRGQYGLFR